MKNAIPYADLRKDLINNRGYSPYEAGTAIRNVRKMSRSVKRAFIQWYNHDVEPTLVIEGFTFQDILEFVTHDKVGAFIFLDFILKSPDEAKRAMVRRTGDSVHISAKSLERMKSISHIEEIKPDEDITDDITIADDIIEEISHEQDNQEKPN